MDAADAESAEVIEAGNTGRTDNFHICGQWRLISLKKNCTGGRNTH